MGRRFAPQAALILAGLASACGPALPTDLDTGDVPAEVTYAEHVAPLMEEACVRCHLSGSTMDGGVELDSYAAVYGARVKNVCVTVGQDVVDAYADVLLPLAGQQGLGPCEGWEVGSMPPGAQPHLTLAQQVTLAEWVAQGGAP